MSSFHNTEPRTREERVAAHNKEMLEKGRLKARPGHGHTAGDFFTSPLQPDPSSALYEANCFQRDVAGYIKQEKLHKLNQQQMKFEKRRQEGAVRESLRWEQMQQRAAAEEQRMQYVREAGLKGKQNKSSEHFNIISLEYNATREGQQLRYKDELTRYRAVLRTQLLANRSHSTQHNIITGQPRATTTTTQAVPPARPDA